MVPLIYNWEHKGLGYQKAKRPFSSQKSKNEKLKALLYINFKGWRKESLLIFLNWPISWDTATLPFWASTTEEAPVKMTKWASSVFSQWMINSIWFTQRISTWICVNHMVLMILVILFSLLHIDSQQHSIRWDSELEQDCIKMIAWDFMEKLKAFLFTMMSTVSKWLSPPSWRLSFGCSRAKPFCILGTCLLSTWYEGIASACCLLTGYLLHSCCLLAAFLLLAACLLLVCCWPLGCH